MVNFCSRRFMRWPFGGLWDVSCGWASKANRRALVVRCAGDREKMVSGWGGISTGGDGHLVQTVRESWENGRNSW